MDKLPYRGVLNFIPALLYVALLTACSTSDVIPEGNDTYMVASHGFPGWSSGATQEAKALERANAYCKQLGKEVQTVTATESAGGVGQTASGEVHFRCVEPAAK
jgi:hypothetical protein